MLKSDERGAEGSRKNSVNWTRSGGSRDREQTKGKPSARRMQKVSRVGLRSSTKKIWRGSKEDLERPRDDLDRIQGYFSVVQEKEVFV